MIDISNEKIILKPISSEDTENIIRWRNSENVRKKFFGSKNVYS